MNLTFSSEWLISDHLVLRQSQSLTHRPNVATPCFCNKILLKRGQAYWFTVYGCFWVIVMEKSGVTTAGPQSQKYLHLVFNRKRVCQLLDKSFDSWWSLQSGKWHQTQIQFIPLISLCKLWSIVAFRLLQGLQLPLKYYEKYFESLTSFEWY